MTYQSPKMKIVAILAAGESAVFIVVIYCILKGFSVLSVVDIVLLGGAIFASMGLSVLAIQFVHSITFDENNTLKCKTLITQFEVPAEDITEISSGPANLYFTILGGARTIRALQPMDNMSQLISKIRLASGRVKMADRLGR